MNQVKYQQISDTLLMVRPARFGFNHETAHNNAFQVNDVRLSVQEISEKAVEEFDEFVRRIRSHGIEVIVIQDTSEPPKTDAVFPNNWFSTHSTGEVVLYPMYSEIRRLERREDIIDLLAEHFDSGNIDRSLLRHEEQDKFLEGTGSLILDRVNRLVYACYSDRTHPELLEGFCKAYGFEPVGFHATDDKGMPVYHTNVIMALGEELAIICLESIASEEERKHLTLTLESSGKQVIDISLDQVHKFVGNMLEVRNSSGAKFMLMSQQAFKNLTPGQLSLIEKYDKVIHSPLETIEKYGGGSARCMLAEIFLRKKVNI